MILLKPITVRFDKSQHRWLSEQMLRHGPNASKGAIVRRLVQEAMQKEQTQEVTK